MPTQFCTFPPRQQAEYFNALQKIALTQTRLKIPLLRRRRRHARRDVPRRDGFSRRTCHRQHIRHGLGEAIYAAAAREARAVGIHVLSTLVLELDRDPRMGRNEEAYTEDPYLYSRIAESIVRGRAGLRHSAPRTKWLR